jgi:hypothetical protein
MTEAVRLTDDEYTILMIANDGESMIPIGRWKDAVEHLVALGYLWQQNQFNCTITERGKQALKTHEGAIDLELAEVFNRANGLWP